jgi:hypothetical protein
MAGLGLQVLAEKTGPHLQPLLDVEVSKAAPTVPEITTVLDEKVEPSRIEWRFRTRTAAHEVMVPRSGSCETLHGVRARMLGPAAARGRTRRCHER